MGLEITQKASTVAVSPGGTLTETGTVNVPLAPVKLPTIEPLRTTDNPLEPLPVLGLARTNPKFHSECAFGPGLVIDTVTR